MILESYIESVLISTIDGKGNKIMLPVFRFKNNFIRFSAISKINIIDKYSNDIVEYVDTWSAPDMFGWRKIISTEKIISKHKICKAGDLLNVKEKHINDITKKISYMVENKHNTFFISADDVVLIENFSLDIL